MDYNTFVELVEERCRLSIDRDTINRPDAEKSAILTAKFDWYKEVGKNPHFNSVYSIMEQLYPTFQWVDGCERFLGDELEIQAWSKTLAERTDGYWANL